MRDIHNTPEMEHLTGILITIGMITLLEHQ
jgi:hypothetical protein